MINNVLSRYMVLDWLFLKHGKQNHTSNFCYFENKKDMRQVKSEKMKQDRQDKKIMRLVKNMIGQKYRMLNRNKIEIR